MRFIENRKRYYYISVAFFALSCVAFFFVPKNYGIDMTGGLQIEYSTANATAVDERVFEAVRKDMLDNYKFENEKVISDIIVYPVKGTSVRADVGLLAEDDVTRAGERSQDIRTKLPEAFKKAGVEVQEASFSAVGQSFGKFVLDRAYLNMVMCLIVICLYLMFAFYKSIEGTSGFTFGAITLMTLIHDVIIAAGIFIFLGLIFPALKIDTFFVTAALTILGYSINDTIVILDRIRSSYRDKRSSDTRSDKQIFDDSINVSVRRSLYTSLTLVMVLVCMLLFGPEALYGFLTLMLLGTIFGTYSSIFIAAPIIYDINSWKK